MSDDTKSAVIGIGGDSGPYASYWRCDDATPTDSNMHHGFGTMHVRVPLALADEYFALKQRCEEIEAEFERVAALPEKTE